MMEVYPEVESVFLMFKHYQNDKYRLNTCEVSFVTHRSSVKQFEAAAPAATMLCRITFHANLPMVIARDRSCTGLSHGLCVRPSRTLSAE